MRFVLYLSFPCSLPWEADLNGLHQGTLSPLATDGVLPTLCSRERKVTSRFSAPGFLPEEFPMLTRSLGKAVPSSGLSSSYPCSPWVWGGKRPEAVYFGVPCTLPTFLRATLFNLTCSKWRVPSLFCWKSKFYPQYSKVEINEKITF